MAVNPLRKLRDDRAEYERRLKARDERRAEIRERVAETTPRRCCEWCGATSWSTYCARCRPFADSIQRLETSRPLKPVVGDLPINDYTERID